jgi:PPOX class probable F420-dependent enzyme
MSVSEQDLDFLATNHSAAMITVGRDGTPKVARVGVGLVDGKVWSSGTADRVRTRRLRRDPRCTLYVHDNRFAWLALESSVTILDGSEAADQNLRLFRAMQSRPSGPLSWYGTELADDEFLQRMVDERRVIYEFEVHHAYGLR